MLVRHLVLPDRTELVPSADESIVAIKQFDFFAQLHHSRVSA